MGDDQRTNALSYKRIGQALYMDSPNDQVMAISSVSAVSSPVSSGGGYVTLCPDVDCHVAFGASSLTATQSNAVLYGRVARTFRMDAPGYVATISKGASTGELFISEGF